MSDPFKDMEQDRTHEEIIAASEFFTKRDELICAPLCVTFESKPKLLFPPTDGIHFEADFCDNGTLVIYMHSSVEGDLKLARYEPIPVAAFSPDAWISVGQDWPRRKQ